MADPERGATNIQLAGIQNRKSFARVEETSSLIDWNKSQEQDEDGKSIDIKSYEEELRLASTTGVESAESSSSPVDSEPEGPFYGAFLARYRSTDTRQEVMLNVVVGVFMILLLAFGLLYFSISSPAWGPRIQIEQEDPQDTLTFYTMPSVEEFKETTAIEVTVASSADEKVWLSFILTPRTADGGYQSTGGDRYEVYLEGEGVDTHGRPHRVYPVNLTSRCLADSSLQVYFEDELPLPGTYRLMVQLVQTRYAWLYSPKLDAEQCSLELVALPECFDDSLVQPPQGPPRRAPAELTECCPFSYTRSVSEDNLLLHDETVLDYSDGKLAFRPVLSFDPRGMHGDAAAAAAAATAKMLRVSSGGPEAEPTCGADDLWTGHWMVDNECYLDSSLVQEENLLFMEIHEQVTEQVYEDRTYPCRAASFPFYNVLRDTQLLIPAPLRILGQPASAAAPEAPADEGLEISVAPDVEEVTAQHLLDDVAQQYGNAALRVQALSSVFNSGQRVWKPAGCRMRQFALAEARQCMDAKQISSITFVGDPRMLYVSLAIQVILPFVKVRHVWTPVFKDKNEIKPWTNSSGDVCYDDFIPVDARIQAYERGQGWGKANVRQIFENPLNQPDLVLVSVLNEGYLDSYYADDGFQRSSLLDFVEMLEFYKFQGEVAYMDTLPRRETQSMFQDNSRLENVVKIEREVWRGLDVNVFPVWDMAIRGRDMYLNHDTPSPFLASEIALVLMNALCTKELDE